MRRKKTTQMALDTKTEKDTVTVGTKAGRQEFSYEYAVVSGNYEDALAHANADGKNAEALAEAYFRIVNTSAKSNARQKVVNANIDPEVKSKQDAIRTMAKAFGWSKEQAAAKFAELAGETEDSE